MTEPADPANWQLLQTLFDLAEKSSDEERAQVLAEHCADTDLVRQALAVFSGSRAPVRQGSAAEIMSLPGRSRNRMGPWTLLRKLGSGGIGAVYLAERIFAGVPQRAAVKLLSPHAAGAAFAERFRREQHILCSLAHPNITRFFDAGLSEAEEPFLAMEFVDGEHVDDYCEQQDLDVERRIGLFLQICDAVAYAHRNLIVHLDIKPSNVLVTHDGTVKLLDFGTSKLIEMDARLTTTLLATPAYASPEQLRNEPVTTACDIYALGAVLFELICGHRPYAKLSVAAMLERAMHSGTPEKMADVVARDGVRSRGIPDARLRPVVRGDLDTIVTKCLEALPQNRYISVDALSDDLRRYLAAQPILARPQTTLYRMRKFVRRNWKAVGAATVAGTLLLVALGAVEVKQRMAVEAGRRAERMQTMLFALFSIAQSRNVGKPTMTVDEFLNLGLETLPLYIHDPADLRAGQMSLALSLYKNSAYPDAERAFSKILATAHPNGDINAEAESEAYLGDLAFRRGNLDEGKRLSKDALELSRSPRVTAAIRVAARTFFAIERQVNGLGSDDDVTLMRQAVQEAKQSKLPASDVAQALEGLGVVMQARGQWDEAETYFKQTISSYAEDPAYVCKTAEVNGSLGRIQRMRGEFAEALIQNRYAFTTVARCSGDTSADALLEEKYVAQDLLLLGRAPEAANLMEHVVPVERQHDAGAKGAQLANALYVLAGAYLAMGKAEDAGALVREEIDMATGKLAPASRGFAAMNLLYAHALADQHREREALVYAGKADDSLQKVGATGSYLDKRSAADARQLLTELRQRVDIQAQATR